MFESSITHIGSESYLFFLASLITIIGLGWTFMMTSDFIRRKSSGNH